MDPRLQPQTPEVDPMVTSAVMNVRDRFGAEGLRDLMALAQMELRNVEAAEQRLAALAEPAATAPEAVDSADTQAWLAYTEAEPERDDRR
ncbi:hypothetical protein E1212_25445 [Jiangella ureilytica]|uniref:Uncharacterized protein n=1 Tax=Jiangella ureilytica TaxID=2530374 RepID=A0A4R4RCX3_9ACTN|nr:hypothetical protein [Jiangella ureilytica]TDC46994.1 hypothetical protein E1212_25445 [Jiangella ureilytica]